MLIKRERIFKGKNRNLYKKYLNGRDIMKIGKFGEVNNISIDTIRHYMDLSLIIPEKREATIFDDDCQTDLELIIHYKDLGFSLNEIKELFFIKI